MNRYEVQTTPYGIFSVIAKTAEQAVEKIKEAGLTPDPADPVRYAGKSLIDENGDPVEPDFG